MIMRDSVDFRVSAVLPAGGRGERLGNPSPKQYMYARGKPVIVYGIQTFESVPWIQQIVIPVENEWLGFMDNLCLTYNFKKVKLVEGSHTRFRSIFNGLKAIKESNKNCDVVVVCDAVRPFIDNDTLSQVTLAAKEYGAAGAIRPLVSTVMCSKEDGFLDHSLDRTKHIASEMPQAFQFDVIYNGFSKATPYDFDYGTECLHVAQKYAGAKVKLISGGENLWKVTYKKDLYAMEYMLKECERPNVILKGVWHETFLSVIQKGLVTKGIEVLYGSNTFCEDFKAEACNGQNCVVHLLESKNFDDELPELRSIVGTKVLILLYVSEIEDSHTFEAWIQKSCQCTKSDVTHIGIMVIGKPNSQDVADLCLEKIPPLLGMVFDGNGGILHGQVFKFRVKHEF